MLSVWVLVFCLAAAARGQLQGQGHVYEQLFHDLDDDGNRFISRAEFNNAVPSLDLDGDGQVTEQEFIRAFQSATSASDANRHAAELLFAAIDSNQDGSVPVNQMDPLFRVFDTDRDGEISNLEFLQEWYNIHPDHGTHQNHH